MFRKTSTTTTTAVTTTTTTATGTTGISTTTGTANLRVRTLAFGYGDVDDSSYGRGGLLDALFVSVVLSNYCRDTKFINDLAADIGHIGFTEYTQFSFFDDVVARIQQRIQDPNWTQKLQALAEQLESAQPSEKRTALLELVTTLLEISKLLELGTSVDSLRDKMSAALKRLDTHLWSREVTEPALSARSSKKKNKVKNALNKAKRKSMEIFAKPDKTKQTKPTKEQLLAQEDGERHADDWAASSEVWKKLGWENDKTNNVPHYDFGKWDSSQL